MNKIRVLIIDDDPFFCKSFGKLLNTYDDIEVIGDAGDPYIARDMIKQLKPDVLTLDIEMPRMDGMTFLKNLMRLHPLPVIMISSLTSAGAESTLIALELGAIDVASKPKVDAEHTLEDYANDIVTKIRTAAKTNVTSFEPLLPSTELKTKPIIGKTPVTKAVLSKQTIFTKLIVLGASTGGTEAIKVVMKSMPADSPPVLITQHLPAAFSQSFVQHVDAVSDMTASIPENGQVVEWGHIYLAPGGLQMSVDRVNNQYVIRVEDSEPVNRHKPSVDVLFHSAAKSAGENAVCVLLTGMGADGAVGMQAMKASGAKTIVQDEASSVVWGMPGAAFKLGCADHVLPLDDIAAKILTLLKTLR